MRSSYKKNNYQNIFQSICFSYDPKLIVEFGILDGYSLDCFSENTNENCLIRAFDLFDEFPYNSASYDYILNKYKDSKNININKGNFYDCLNLFDDNSIDILHIDIANNGEVYEFAISHYLKKVKGLMILEGGSEERDEVEWMIKYNKPKIVPVLKKYEIDVKMTVIKDYPSLTLIKK